MRKGFVLLAAAALKLAGQEPAPQSNVPPRPAFAVASVKPTDLSLNQAIDMRVLPGGTVTATAVTLKFLITVAYEVENVQISGGPSWLDTERFDIRAKPTEGEKLQFREMLQSLLEDRFKLQVQRETKATSVYTLTVAKPGSFGPNLTPSQIANCPTQPGTRATVPCGGFLLLDGRLTGQRVQLAQLTSPLSRMVDRPVVDHTGVTTAFDITLEWAPLRAQSNPDNNLHSIFPAVQEQLGLKLESGKEPVPMLVIQHAELPSAN
jgi:uncharacterized protein (TIGR03435 family)